MVTFEIAPDICIHDEQVSTQGEARELFLLGEEMEWREQSEGHNIIHHKSPKQHTNTNICLLYWLHLHGYGARIVCFILGPSVVVALFN